MEPGLTLNHYPGRSWILFGDFLWALHLHTHSDGTARYHTYFGSFSTRGADPGDLYTSRPPTQWIRFARIVCIITSHGCCRSSLEIRVSILSRILASSRRNQRKHGISVLLVYSLVQVHTIKALIQGPAARIRTIEALFASAQASSTLRQKVW
ncbi:hypothetical protein BJ508DRAFT_108685 [Ascobolus immersus RN42]|uniref:Uncharacterized protein n=1 Tax=Ascobolus immersus RN42 TaxID=1160509 RepID=A0A3N4I718_ASCIM|nr:hypothetical protein BJ508DRAFT_108685 [Ascobolus immersus RN42]